MVQNSHWSVPARCILTVDGEDHKSLICDNGATTQNLAFLSYWYWFADALLTGIVSYRSVQNSPLESSCVVAALIEKYSTSKSLNVSPAKKKSLILSCDIVVANERKYPHWRNFLLPNVKRVSSWLPSTELGIRPKSTQIRNAYVGVLLSSYARVYEHRYLNLKKSCPCV